MKLSVGLQLYTVRAEMQKDFLGTLKKVKEIGYDGVEFAGLYGHSAKEVKEMLDDVGLEAVSAHVPLRELIDNIDETIDTYKKLGVSHITIPYLEEDDRPNGGGFDQTISRFIEIGKKVKAEGLCLLYHNHDFEFEKIDGEYVLDVIYDKVPKELLQTELDTCWINVAGEDPADYIMKYKERSPVVHLKDFVMEEESGKEVDEGREGFSFRPVGYGKQDFKSIIAASKKAKTKWVIVEQDREANGIKLMESAKLSFEYIVGLDL